MTLGSVMKPFATILLLFMCITLYAQNYYLIQGTDIVSYSIYQLNQDDIIIGGFYRDSILFDNENHHSDRSESFIFYLNKGLNLNWHKTISANKYGMVEHFDLNKIDKNTFKSYGQFEDVVCFSDNCLKKDSCWNNQIFCNYELTLTSDGKMIDLQTREHKTSEIKTDGNKKITFNYNHTFVDLKGIDYEIFYDEKKGNTSIRGKKNDSTLWEINMNYFFLSENTVSIDDSNNLYLILNNNKQNLLYKINTSGIIKLEKTFTSSVELQVYLPPFKLNINHLYLLINFYGDILFDSTKLEVKKDGLLILDLED